MATPPIPVTTVLINPTSHSRRGRGRVISMATVVASRAPPAAAPPAALNAAAPATPLLVGSGVVNRKPKESAQGGFNGRKKTARGRPLQERTDGSFQDGVRVRGA